MAGRFGCLSDPEGYVLGTIQVKGKTPGRPCGGKGVLGNSLTLLPCMLTGKTTKTNLKKTDLSEAKSDF